MYDYKFDVKIGSKVVNCRAFTLEEYLGLISAKKDGTLEETINNLILKCSNAKNLNKQESELLIVNLWAHSMGKVNQENTWRCSCGHETQTYINLLYTQIDDPDDLWLTIRGIKIKFRYPRIFEDKNTAHMIVSCIESVFVNGENIPVDDLTEEEINDLYAFITEEDIITIKDLLLKPTVQLSVPIKCESCGASHVHTIRGLKEFFKLM